MLVSTTQCKGFTSTLVWLVHRILLYLTEICEKSPCLIDPVEIEYVDVGTQARPSHLAPGIRFRHVDKKWKFS